MTTEHDEGFAAGGILPPLPPADRFPGEYHENYSADEMRAWALAACDAQHAASIEAAAGVCTGKAFNASGDTIANALTRAAAAIRALNPAPRSAKHTAEPSAQERERDAKLRSLVYAVCVAYKADDDDSIFRHSAALDELYAFWALATAPSTRIEAEPVNDHDCGYLRGSVLCRICDIRQSEEHDRTPDARIEAEPMGEVEYIGASDLVCIKYYGEFAPTDGAKLYLAPDARSTMAAQSAAPEGSRLVPDDPTDDMIRAGRNVHQHFGSAEAIYSAMLAASPAAQVAQSEANNLIGALAALRYEHGIGAFDEAVRHLSIPPHDSQIHTPVAQADARSTSDALRGDDDSVVFKAGWDAAIAARGLRSTSDAAVVLPAIKYEIDERVWPAIKRWFEAPIETLAAEVDAAIHCNMREYATVAVKADRATRSTASSAEAA